MTVARPTPRDRALSALCSAALVAALGYLLVIGLGVRMPAKVETGLALFDVVPAPAPRVRIVPKPSRKRRPTGTASPPNLRSRATPVVAPTPIIAVPLPTPVIAAPTAGMGSDVSQGAAEVAGPGTGAGGRGEGTGSGGSGDGDGGDRADETPPRRVRGRIRDSDYPEGAAEAGAGGVVSVRFTVEVNGRATRCRVTGSSGNAELDATTCRLIEERFRYAPSRDAAGRPVRSVVVMDNEWVLEREPEG
jgi:protein TonB